MASPLRVGVSACLLGQNVRYDGRHKEDDLVTGLASRSIELVPVCPEVELGLGTPREPIQLRRDGELLRLVAPGSGRDHTAAMRRFAEERVRALAELQLCGFVLKKDSPSCGVARVPVWSGEGPAPVGRGAFASVLMDLLPLLPVVEGSALHDPVLRERFVARVRAYRRPSS